MRNLVFALGRDESERPQKIENSAAFLRVSTIANYLVVFVAVVITVNIVARYVTNIFPITMNEPFVTVVMCVSCWSVLRFVMRSILWPFIAMPSAIMATM